MKPSMKPLTNWSWRKPFFLGLSAVAILMSVACSKNESSPPPPPPPPPVVPIGPVIPTCSGCPGNVNAFLASGVGKVMGGSEMEINAEFFGDSSIGNTSSSTYQQGYYSLYQNYYGAFAGQAALFVAADMPFCQIPAGVYTLRTMQPGVWGADGAGRSLQGIYLEASGGPTQIQVYLDAWINPSVPAVRGRDGRQYPFTVVGTIQVKRADQPAHVFCQRIME